MTYEGLTTKVSVQHQETFSQTNWFCPKMIPI